MQVMKVEQPRDSGITLGERSWNEEFRQSEQLIPVNRSSHKKPAFLGEVKALNLLCWAEENDRKEKGRYKSRLKLYGQNLQAMNHLLKS